MSTREVISRPKQIFYRNFWLLKMAYFPVAYTRQQEWKLKFWSVQFEIWTWTEPISSDLQVVNHTFMPATLIMFDCVNLHVGVWLVNSFNLENFKVYFLCAKLEKRIINWLGKSQIRDYYNMSNIFLTDHGWCKHKKPRLKDQFG